MERYQLSAKNQKFAISIQLPYSKSISNRMLIIQALSNKRIAIANLSDSDDTRVLQKALLLESNKINIGHAGTAMRFMTAFLATQPGYWELTGSDRMQNRPIKILVDALRELGADIKYLQKEGYPPLGITGKKLTGEKIKLEGSVSSQYISAIMMIAPTLANGLRIELKNKVVSKPYIDMTAQLMQQMGINISQEDCIIKIPSEAYQKATIKVEPDWSAASYWYELVALSEDGKVLLNGLSKESVQGDAKIRKLFGQLGVNTEFTERGALLSKTNKKATHYSANLIEQPDLSQTLVVSLCLLGIPFELTGLESLKIKETDRIVALQQELAKFGYPLQATENSMTWDGNKIPTDKETYTIQTYNDHRMALAFAPIALQKNGVIIEHPNVVSKSYPDYWSDLELIRLNHKEL